LNLKDLYPRLRSVMERKNAIITKIYGGQPIDLEETFEKCKSWAEILRPYIQPTEQVLYKALDEGKIVLLEGAQGALLDLDHGSYPYVTSSNPTVGGACIGLGISPQNISGVAGVFKAYSTRVGSGPFPSELTDETANIIRELAWEYGTTTGRPRRCGWFDAVASKYSARVNGFTSAVLTRLDVLDGFPSVKICTAYELDGKRIDYFPSGSADLERCQPVLEEVPGWTLPTASTTKFEDLPAEAVNYVRRIEKLIGVPVDLISTGPHRHETVQVKSLF